MKHCTTLRLAPLAVLVISMVGTSVESHDYHTEAAREVAGQLEQFTENVENELQLVVAGFKKDNDVLTAYNKYKKTVEKAADSECHGKGHPTSIKSKKDIDALVDKCKGECELSGSDKRDLKKKVEDAIEQVKNIDKSLHKTIEKCDKHPADTCEEEKKHDEEALDSFLSLKHPGSVREFGAIIIAKGLNQLNNCFQKHTEGMCKKFQDATEEIENCISKHDTPID